jgi:hypothetical protein
MLHYVLLLLLLQAAVSPWVLGWQFAAGERITQSASVFGELDSPEVFLTATAPQRAAVISECRLLSTCLHLCRPLLQHLLAVHLLVVLCCASCFAYVVHAMYLNYIQKNTTTACVRIHLCPCCCRQQQHSARPRRSGFLQLCWPQGTKCHSQQRAFRLAPPTSVALNNLYCWPLLRRSPRTAASAAGAAASSDGSTSLGRAAATASSVAEQVSSVGQAAPAAVSQHRLVAVPQVSEQALPRQLLVEYAPVDHLPEGLSRPAYFYFK